MCFFEQFYGSALLKITQQTAAEINQSRVNIASIIQRSLSRDFQSREEIPC